MEEKLEPGREQQAAELLVFLFLILPSILLSLIAAGEVPRGFALLAASTIFRDLALVSLILYFLWRNSEPLEKIGWGTDSLARESVLGVLLFPLVTLGAALIGSGLRDMGLSGSTGPARSILTPRGPEEFVLAFFLVVVVAFAEETIFRGYLIPRLAQVSRSTVFAVIVSSAIFSVGHGYEGAAGVVTVGIMGLALSLLFLWRKSLVAPMMIHFLNYFTAILLLPLLQGM